MSLRRLRRLAFVCATAVVAACSSSPAGDACPSDLPASCPTPTPSYRTDIVPIVQGFCYPCHAPGGVEASQFDFSTYQGVFASRSTILDQVYACQMPPVGGVASAGVDAGSPPLTTTARVTLLGWLVCNAPDN